MITIQKYERTKDQIIMELFISNPYTNNSEVKREVFFTDEAAQHYYWNLIWSYLNFGVEQFVEHCKSISENYLNPRAVPFYNDESWRQNFWELTKKFNTDYFCGVIDTIENKAQHIREYKAILKKGVTLYNEAGHKEAKQMVNELIGFAENIIKHKVFIQELKEVA
tara:strand:+ start:213 stop:710 length:498 start_codon:yes stop_codon:yes gene_type:complete